jgi:hypothetical protein
MENQKRAVKAETVKVPPPTEEQLESFNQLKEALSSEQFLIHDDSHVPLMMAIDASYEFGYGVTVYQVPAMTMEDHDISVEQIQRGDYDRRMDRVVMFLSKELTAAETVYWPTELETAALVFAVKKTRHLIEANDFPTIIHTDHVAVKHVAHATSLNKTTSPERANMRLIRASQYLSQFRLDVRYKPGKENVVAFETSSREGGYLYGPRRHYPGSRPPRGNSVVYSDVSRIHREVVQCLAGGPPLSLHLRRAGG